VIESGVAITRRTAAGRLTPAFGKVDCRATRGAMVGGRVCAGGSGSVYANQLDTMYSIRQKSWRHVQVPATRRRKAFDGLADSESRYTIVAHPAIFSEHSCPCHASVFQSKPNPLGRSVNTHLQNGHSSQIKVNQGKSSLRNDRKLLPVAARCIVKGDSYIFIDCRIPGLVPAP
jgi:hypothetical protein